MASPTFLHELSKEQFKKLSQDDIQKIYSAEQFYWENKPYTAYHFAFNGSKTKNGGYIRASNDSLRIKGISLALIGDDVIYADGATAKIISGKGKAFEIDGRSAALVGSLLENSDQIIDTPETSLVFRLYHDQIVPNDFLNHDLKEDNHG